MICPTAGPREARASALPGRCCCWCAIGRAGSTRLTAEADFERASACLCLCTARPRFGCSQTLARRPSDPHLTAQAARAVVCFRAELCRLGNESEEPGPRACAIRLIVIGPK